MRKALMITVGLAALGASASAALALPPQGTQTPPHQQQPQKPLAKVTPPSVDTIKQDVSKMYNNIQQGKNTPPKPPAAQPANAPSVDAIKQNVSKMYNNIQQGKNTPPNQPAAQPTKPPSVADLTKDVVKMQTYIDQTSKEIADWQRTKANSLHFVQNTTYKWDPSQIKCDTSGNCTAHVTTYTIGEKPTRFTHPIPLPGGGSKGTSSWPTVLTDIRVDQSGRPLPGEQDKILAAAAHYYDAKIAADQKKIDAMRQQINADYAANPQMLGGGGNPRGSNTNIKQF